MPFKLRFQTLARATGKDEIHGDLKEMPGNKEPQSDFVLLLKSVEPKLKTHLKSAAADEKAAETKELHEFDEEVLTPANQGLFAPPITALEQMLGRQQHDEKILIAEKSGVSDTETVPVATSNDAKPIIGDKDVRQLVAAAAAAATPEKKTEPVKGEERPAKLGTSSVSATVAQPVSEPLPQSAGVVAKGQSDIPPTLASLSDGKPEKRDSKPAAEITKPDAAIVTDKTTPQQVIPALPQGTAKPPIGNFITVAAPVSRPAVIDVQVVSDRTVGAARTLVIQLQPVELGTVTARLRLTPDGMHIQIAAASAAMVEHLSNDREALGKALHKAGVTDDASSVTISIVDRSLASSGSTQTGQQNLNGQDQQTASRGNSQGQSAFQNMPNDRPANQHIFGEVAPDDHVEKLTKEVQVNSSRGLVV